VAAAPFQKFWQQWHRALKIHTFEFAAGQARQKLVHQAPTSAAVGNILNKNGTIHQLSSPHHAD